MTPPSPFPPRRSAVYPHVEAFLEAERALQALVSADCTDDARPISGPTAVAIHVAWKDSVEALRTILIRSVASEYNAVLSYEAEDIATMVLGRFLAARPYASAAQATKWLRETRKNLMIDLRRRADVRREIDGRVPLDGEGKPREVSVSVDERDTVVTEPELADWKSRLLGALDRAHGCIKAKRRTTDLDDKRWAFEQTKIVGRGYAELSELAPPGSIYGRAVEPGTIQQHVHRYLDLICWAVEFGELFEGDRSLLTRLVAATTKSATNADRNASLEDADEDEEGDDDLI